MVSEYINKLLVEFATRQALEHSYRPALKSLFESIDEKIRAQNDPSRSEYGAPDFVIFDKNNLSLIRGYAETKDINVDLDKTIKTEQIKRYLGYSNLLVTNYLEFRFFRNGNLNQIIAIGKFENSRIIPFEENYPLLEREIKAFLEGSPETITSAVRLAEIMGGKAARIRDNVIKYLKEQNDKNQELQRIYNVMQELLVHDLTVEKFADMYAQTLVYGLFVARYFDETPEDFTRQEARDLIPASNPFLRHFFDHIAGVNFDKRLQYIVDELCDVFAVSAVREIVTQHYDMFGEAVDKDPVIHFYEDFLKEYDPELKKNMGAYYTPVPVVQFIIRAVDEILKKEFNLAQGLADTTKIEQQIMQQGTKSKRTIHRVQLLDPAVGTATFLNETVKYIHEKFKGQEGVWESYVEKELLPRLHGFELMMAPYTIAHLKLAMTFKDTGISHFDHRLGVYLTNTLEEGIKDQRDLFGAMGLADAISKEAHSANKIKHDMPIMVVIGNPPYSISSSNKGEWIQNLVDVYKKSLGEQNINSLSDDYIKFIRFAEYMIGKNGSGIVALITNNSFIDGITHRQMRKHLLETFDDIYILDLHGNAKKKETAIDGGKDENVFDIQQGVSINIFVRKDEKKKELGNVYHANLYGSRKKKFEALNGNSLNSIKWQKIAFSEPYYFFSPKDFEFEKTYNSGFKLDELFIKNSAGTKFRKDGLLVKNHFYRESVFDMLNDMHSLTEQQLTQKYGFKETEDWKIEEKKYFFTPNDGENIRLVLYKPFDYRWTYYPTNSVNKIIPRGDSRLNLMKHFIYHTNLGLITNRQIVNENWSHIEVTQTISSHGTFYLGNKGQDYILPLYFYHDDGTKTSNLKIEIVKQIEEIVGSVSPEEVFDYIYAVLHSPSYRQKYKEFLKIDFPRIPYPKDKETFEKLVKLGGKLRQLHLMEDPDLGNLSTIYPIGGENVVEKVEFAGDKVIINENQYFGNVPKVAWDFYIGGYQPAQKWLKDRKGRKLTYEDTQHYQKIIKVLTETSEIMKRIDEV